MQPGSANMLSMDTGEQQAKFAAERISHHENSMYGNFSFFLTLSTAILGGLGYLAIGSDKLPGAKDYWTVQKIAWGLWYLECAVGWFFALLIGLHYYSIRSQWKKQANLKIKASEVPWWHVIKHAPLFYMILAELLLPLGLYLYLVKPLFK